MATTPTTLTESVQNAFETESKGAPAETTEAKIETKVEPTLAEEKAAADKKLEDGIIEVEASPDEIRAALNLSRMLSDPDKATAYIKYLAEQGGYDITKRSEAKALAKDSKAILREKLGEAYDVLGGDKLAEAFDSILETKVKEATKPLEESNKAALASANEQKADAAMQSFFARNKISDDVKVREELAGRMMAKMTKMPPTTGVDVSEYLDDIYTVVNKGNAANETTKRVVTRMTANAKEAKVSGEGSGAQEERIKVGSKKPSLDEAVRAGFEGKRFDFE